ARAGTRLEHRRLPEAGSTGTCTRPEHRPHAAAGSRARLGPTGRQLALRARPAAAEAVSAADRLEGRLVLEPDHAVGLRVGLVPGPVVDDRRNRPLPPRPRL